MRTYFVLFALCFISLIGFGQQLQLEKASPFTAVTWENKQPIVQFNNEWYTLEKLDIYTTKELLDFCKSQFGTKWKKRFSEDLIEVLKKMGSRPKEKVNLVLSFGEQQKNVIGIYSFENRQKVLKYNYQIENKRNKLKKITLSQAIEDIEEFQQILEKRSSYVQVSSYNYKSAINSLKTKISISKNDIDINYLAYELAKIMAEIGDRHSSVKNESFIKKEHPTYALQLPFSIAALKGKAIALKRIEKEGIYEYFHPDYPYIKSINNVAIDRMIDSLVYRSKKAPKETKFRRGLSEIQQLGKLYFTNNLPLPKQIKVVFTNGKKDKTEIVQLQKEQFQYYSKLKQNTFLKSRDIKEGNFKQISKLLTGNIGYISLPEMYHFGEIEGLEQCINSTLAAFYNTKALVIDLRFNPGGGRDLIQKLAKYNIPKSNAPWVANVAYLRTEEKANIHTSMSNRFLYRHTSSNFNAFDKKAIDEFSKDFVLQKEFDSSKFSNPHYMVLESGNMPYAKPIYILVNEHSFSAATVFTSAFKGLPNIKIVGVTTDGSSGNSKKMNLKHSKIRVRISTMLSFQRNGKTLDGNGTKPDIYIPEDEEQVLKGNDTQLKKLIEIINNR
ncbi:S41 family peptidase [uncultured Aquimarina sp.]|uniref:S41 family peptidase n=1 Tax=uncultured Aquimarina sp. TaxID=575652 RepID=UPI00262A6BA1|nr:S41 family peptidase [uncultured Aquimarina sp.]